MSDASTAPHGTSTDGEREGMECPVCGGAGDQIGTHVRDGERWRCLACRSCACQYWYPRVIRVGFYADGMEATYERRHTGEGFLRPRHHLFLSRATPGTLLDIGCGEGAFISEAQRRGFTVSGIDLDPESIRVARERGLARVYATPLFDADGGELSPTLRAAGKFDHVTAFEVLEHQARPLELLRAARSLLAPGGQFCGSVPNRERLFVTSQRRSNAGDFPPHHFLWFSAETLADTLRRAGFAEVRVLPVPEDDVLTYAAYLEDALLGTVTKAAKRRVRSLLSRKPATAGPAGATADLGGGPRKAERGGVAQLARLAKNLPFVPLALAASRGLPHKARTIYFEAR